MLNIRFCSFIFFLTVLAGTPASADIVTAHFLGFGSQPTDDPPNGLTELDVSLRQTFGNNYNGTVYTYQDTQEAINDILSSDIDSLVLVGHSFGGQAVVNVARNLQSHGIIVDLTVQIDSVGSDDDLLPENVRTGYNYYQQGDLINGETNVNAADPERTTISNFKVESLYGVADNVISHTEIDNARFERTISEYQAIFGAQPDLHQRITGHVWATIPEPSTFSLVLPLVLASFVRRRRV